MIKIGLLVIATGKYDRFLKPLFDSVDKFFFADRNKFQVTKFVFTDKQELPFENTVRCSTQHEPWPGPTLHRYHSFLRYKTTLEIQDYLFYSDADMLFVDHVGEGILGDGLTATRHPGFWDKPREQYTFETNPESLAYIPPDKGKGYFAGGFQGGKTFDYLYFAEVIKGRIDDDAKRGITAVWHDESHWNKILSEAQSIKILDPGYCYPEGAQLPFKQRLLALNKDHAFMRS